MTRPRPAVEPLTQPFWDAAARGTLVVQRCAGCRAWQHPPALRCHRCGGERLAFEPVRGTGRLVSWTTVHQGLAPGFAAAVPYMNLLVELDEQPGLLVLSDTASAPIANWTPRHGAAMEVWFERVDEGMVLPQFRPREVAR